MLSYRSILNSAEIDSVAAFIADAFIQRRSSNQSYHTAENGWPEHQRRYGAAFPFVLGEIAVDVAKSNLTTRQLYGLDLFRESCTTCHVGKKNRDEIPLWASNATWPRVESPSRSKPPALPDVVGPPEVPAETEYAGGYGYGGPAQAGHDIPPALSKLTQSETAGEHLYQANCAYCHAADGTGRNQIGSFLEPRPTDFTDPKAVAHLSDGQLEQAILWGLPETSMPAFRSALSEEEAEAIVAYLKRAFLTR